MTDDSARPEHEDGRDSGVMQWIERERSRLKGNSTEYARGYESCLDSLEEKFGGVGDDAE